MRLLVPVLDHGCAVTTHDGVVHAVDIIGRERARPWRRKTVDTVCGRQRARLLCVTAVNPDGDTIGNCIAAWPPPLRLHPRCDPCMAATGTPRPHPWWRELRNPS